MAKQEYKDCLYCKHSSHVKDEFNRPYKQICKHEEIISLVGNNNASWQRLVPHLCGPDAKRFESKVSS